MHRGFVQAVRPLRGVDVQLYTFMTTSLVGREVSVTTRPLFTPGKDPVHIVQEAWGGGPGPVWTGKSPPGLDPRNVQPVATRFTD